MHHPETLDFELDAVTGRDFGFYPLGRRQVVFFVWEKRVERIFDEQKGELQ